MRRMLDPKTIGGSGGSASHAYRIVIDDYCWFLSFTEKDYGYQIGKSISIPNDFYTNDYYKELLSEGYHPAGGYYNGNSANMIASSIEKTQTRYWIGGYHLEQKRNLQVELKIQTRVVKIVQLN